MPALSASSSWVIPADRRSFLREAPSVPSISCSTVSLYEALSTGLISVTQMVG
jgi:hypothetical protein